MSLDKKVILNETAHLEGSPAIRESESNEKRVFVVPAGPGNGNNRPKNILAHLSKDDLVNDVRMFAAEKGLEEYLPELEKGALLAQRPDDYDEIDELTDEDRASIRYEKEHKWSHPLWLWLTIIICSTGKFLLSILRMMKRRTTAAWTRVWDAGSKSHQAGRQALPWRQKTA